MIKAILRRRLMRVCGCISGGVLLLLLVGSRPATAQDPTEFLRRLDTNNDGRIDASEMEGRMGGFIRRMVENNPNLDASQPIPIEDLAREFTRMREERAQGGQPGGGGSATGGPGGGWGGRGGGDRGGGGDDRRGGDRGDDRRGGDRGGDRGEASQAESRTAAPEVEPLVPGFDVELPSAAVPPGFGAEGELFAIQITEADRQQAARAFAFYDRNNDGVIDAEEMRRGRRGQELLQYDRNRDGVITLDEMEYRYARRRIERERAEQAEARAQRADGDQRGGRERRRRDREEDSEFESRFAGRNSYRVIPVGERLPAGVPDWFIRSDADGDGQLTMREFSASWSQAVLADFNQFDLNGDGLITVDEVLRAKRMGAVRGSPVTAATAEPSSSASDDFSGSRETLSPAADPPAREEDTTAGDVSAASRPTATAADSTGGGEPIDPQYMAYFRQLIAQYDTNGDGVLTEDEWVRMSRNPEAADVNGDGRITVEEYARWALQR